MGESQITGHDVSWEEGFGWQAEQSTEQGPSLVSISSLNSRFLILLLSLDQSFEYTAKYTLYSLI